MKLRGMFELLLVVLVVSMAGLGWPQDRAEKTEKKAKISEIEAVISHVGQRTITYKYERKGKMRTDVVGIDEQTQIEGLSKDKLSLKDLREGDKVRLIYEPNAYTPAKSIQVVGKEETKKKKSKEN